MTEYLTHLKELLHETLLGRVPMLERALFQLIDFLTGPITGVGTRLHWFQILESIGLVLLVYVSGRHVRPSGGWGGFIRYCLPKRLYAHPSSMVDYQLAILNACFGFLFNLTWRLNTVVITGLLLSGLVAMFGPAPHAADWTPPLLIGITVLIVVTEDLGNYTFHYLGHKIPTLWALHKVHHSAEVLTPLTAFRTHPLEYVLAGNWRGVFTSLVLAPVIYLFTGPPEPVEIFGIGALVVVLGALGTVLQHSHVWLSFGRRLDHIFCVPSLHQVHHSQAPHHWDKNFGVIFSVWDWMFGTLVRPDKPEKLVLGLAGATQQPHPNALAAWLLPLWEMVPLHARIMDTITRFLGPSARALAVRMNLMPLPSSVSQSPDQASRS